MAMFAQILLYVGGAAVAVELDTQMLPAGVKIANVDRVFAKVITGTTDFAVDVALAGSGTLAANRDGVPLFTPVQVAAP